MTIHSSQLQQNIYPDLAVYQKKTEPGILAGLYEALSCDSQQLFVEAVTELDWTARTASQIKEAIDLALEIGCHSIAADLADMGHALYPDDPALEQISKVLAPPKVIRRDIPPVKGVGTSMKWLKANSDQYKGEWVVMKNGQLLCHTASKEELPQILDNLDTLVDVIVTKAA